MTEARVTTAAEQYRDFVHEVQHGSRVKVETPNAIGDVDVSIFQADTLAAHIAAQDAKIAKLVEVAHKVPERWAWGRGPNYQRRVCSDCGAVGELGSWDSPLPHNELCTYAQARQALASIGETDD